MTSEEPANESVAACFLRKPAKNKTACSSSRLSSLFTFFEAKNVRILNIEYLNFGRDSLKNGTKKKINFAVYLTLTRIVSFYGTNCSRSFLICSYFQFLYNESSFVVDSDEIKSNFWFD